MRHRDVQVLLIALSSQIITACYSPPVRFHEVAVPASLRDTGHDFGLPFDAYVIGVEKDNLSRVGKVEECSSGASRDACLTTATPYYVANPDLLSELQDKYRGQLRPTFVSHIVRFSGDPSVSPCFLYNLYQGPDSAGTFCEGIAPLRPVDKMQVHQSWVELSALKTEIKNTSRRIGATHLIVYAMGWNTPQWEAFQNYRALFKQLQDAARDSGASAFRPLFFGITWPSTGSPKLPGSDYGIKAKDADEVGELWGNLLINRVLAEVRHDLGIPLVVVGHSFGARATSRAVFSAPLMDPPAGHRVDLLISLQGAYSYQRFVPKKESGSDEPEERSAYRDFSERAHKVVLTASERDEAVTKAFHAKYFAGSKLAYENSKQRPASKVLEHIEAEANGKLPQVSCDERRVLYVEATKFIKDPQPGTGGLAHSDIYDKEVGNLTAQLIEACAPGKAWISADSN